MLDYYKLCKQTNKRLKGIRSREDPNAAQFAACVFTIHKVKLLLTQCRQQQYKLRHSINEGRQGNDGFTY